VRAAGQALTAESAFVEVRAESGLRHQVDAAFARAGVTRRIAFELSTSDAVVRFVALGFGPAIVPRSTAADRTTMNATVRITTASSCQPDIIAGHDHDAEVVPFTPSTINRRARRATCAVRELVAAARIGVCGTTACWNPVQVIVSLVYQVARKLLAVAPSAQRSGNEVGLWNSRRCGSFPC
jgi:hypothetical protein